MTARERGASLVELLIGLVFVGLFAGGVHQFSRAMLRGVRVLEAASEAQEGARVGIELVVHDLRGAGYGADGALGNGLRLAHVDAIEIAADLNADGDTDDSQEVVGYRLDPSRRTLMRVLGGVAQPMLADIAADGFRLSYFAADGTALSAAPALADDVRKQVRRVDVRLAIEVINPDPAYATPIRNAQLATISLRNQR